jgi:hypothetical protein
MRLSLRSMALAGVLATGLLAFGPTSVKAQGYGGYDGGGYGQGYGGGGYAQGYGGGSYGGGYQQYYGNGGHDFQPHWHNTTTPYGSFSWYGNGAHDLQPHEHVRSPYGGYRGYSANPFGGVTESIYPSTPYTYMPW